MHVGRETKHDLFHFAGGNEIGDVASEALFACLDLLEQRRLAGIAECAAGTRFFFKYSHSVSVRDQRRIRQAGGSRPDHGDALATRWLRAGK